MTRKKEVPPQEKRCQMRAGTARQCRAARQKGSGFCFFHEPEAILHRLALDRLEGLPLQHSSELQELLAETVHGEMEGRLNPQQAYAVACLVRELRTNTEGLRSEMDFHGTLGRALEDEPASGDEQESKGEEKVSQEE